MSSLARLAVAPAAARIFLLGTGGVGSAFVARYQRLRQFGWTLPAIAIVGNSRGLVAVRDDDPAMALAAACAAAAGPMTAALPEPEAGDVVVDASASEALAACHAAWLAAGVHVVTANKLGRGAGLERAEAIAVAAARGTAGYGDSATVGAGLPLIRTLGALVAGGDRIHRVEGVLSGSLAWLFNHYDGMRPFSGFVRQARQAGYTEPDPRIDLSGEDVRRKLLILARTAGLALQADAVQVQSLVPPELAALPLAQVDAGLDLLDAPLAERFGAAHRQGGRLRLVGRFDGQGNASVGLQVLAAEHALCGGSGTDNKVAISSDRYDAQPLVIQGPGAGTGVTAAALLDDLLALLARR